MTTAVPPLSSIGPDGRLQLNFHAGQMAAYESEARIVIVLAGAQSGKTTFGPHWLAREMSRSGPGDYLVVAPTFTIMDKKVGPEFKRLFSQQMKWGKYTGGGSPKFVVNAYGESWLFGEQARRKDNPPTVVYFNHAQDPEALASMTARAVWCDEPGQKKFKLGSWEEISRRVAVTSGRVLMTTTPYNSGGWFKELCDRAKVLTPWGKVEPSSVAPGVAPPRIEIVHFKSTMNPAFPLEEYDDARRTMPRWRFDLMYDALFTRPAGVIYDCYDGAIHKVQPFDLPVHWPRYLGLDFGGVHTAGVLLAAELDGTGHETGKLFLYREYPAAARWQARPTWEHAREIKKGEMLLTPKGPVRLTGGKDDPPGNLFKRAVGGARSEDKWREEFRAAGINCQLPPVADVEVGINRVYSALQAKELFVFSSCVGVLDQLEGYTRELDDRGQPTEKIEDKDQYHYLDAVRYILSYLKGGKKEAGLW